MPGSQAYAGDANRNPDANRRSTSSSSDGLRPGRRTGSTKVAESRRSSRAGVEGACPPSPASLLSCFSSSAKKNPSPRNNDGQVVSSPLRRSSRSVSPSSAHTSRMSSIEKP